MSTIDWREVIAVANKAGATEIVPPGKYLAEAESVTATTSSTGKAMWKIRFKIANGPQEGNKVFTQIVLSPGNNKAIGMFMRNLSAFGVSKDFLATDPTNEAIAEAMEGRVVEIEVEADSWRGEPRAAVRWINKARTGSGAAKLDSVAAQRLIPEDPAVNEALSAGESPDQFSLPGF